MRFSFVQWVCVVALAVGWRKKKQPPPTPAPPKQTKGRTAARRVRVGAQLLERRLDAGDRRADLRHLGGDLRVGDGGGGEDGRRRRVGDDAIGAAAAAAAGAAASASAIAAAAAAANAAAAGDVGQRRHDRVERRRELLRQRRLERRERVGLDARAAREALDERVLRLLQRERALLVDGARALHELDDLRDVVLPAGLLLVGGGD